MARARGRGEVGVRPGGSSLLDPNRRLPRAQFSVRQDVWPSRYLEQVAATRRFTGGLPIPALEPERLGARYFFRTVPLAKQAAQRPFVARYSYQALRDLLVRAPARVKFCVRRQERKEVLFALGKAGFSGSARGRRRVDGRLYRRDASSSYRC